MTKQDAIKHFGSSQKLAYALDITPQAVFGWGETIPVPRQYQIEVLTQGALKADRSKSVA